MTDSGGGRPFLRTATFGVGVAHRRVVERTEGLRPVGGGRLVAGVVGVAFLVRGKDRDAEIEALGIPRDLWWQFGAFRDPGPGAYLALVGASSVSSPAS